MAIRPSATVSLMAKTALKSGSSKHGKARRQSVDCICEVAMVRTRPDSSVNVERYQPRNLSFRIPLKVSVILLSSDSSYGAVRMSRSDSSCNSNGTSSPLMAALWMSNSMAFSTISVALNAVTVILTEPVKVAASKSGVSDTSYRYGITVRGRRKGSSKWLTQ